jgi:acetyl esterase/lipase
VQLASHNKPGRWHAIVCAAVLLFCSVGTVSATDRVTVTPGGDSLDRIKITVHADAPGRIRINVFSRVSAKTYFSWAEFFVNAGENIISDMIPVDGISKKKTKWMLFWARQPLEKVPDSRMYARYTAALGQSDHLIVLERDGRFVDQQSIHFKVRPSSLDGVTVRRVDLPSMGGVLYQPSVQGPAPLILSIGGNPKRTDFVSSMALARMGVLVFEPDYHARYGKDWCFSRVPVEAFVAAIRELSKRFVIDQGRVGIVGGSRGAEAAAYIARKKYGIRFAVLSAFSVWPMPGGCSGADAPWTVAGRPVPFVEGPWWLLGGFIGLPWMSQRDLLVKHIVKKGPLAAKLPTEEIDVPTLLIGAEDDTLVPSAESVRIICGHSPCDGTSVFRAFIGAGADHYLSEPPWVPMACRLDGMAEPEERRRCEATAIARERAFGIMGNFITEMIIQGKPN